MVKTLDSTDENFGLYNVDTSTDYLDKNQCKKLLSLLTEFGFFLQNPGKFDTTPVNL